MTGPTKRKPIGGDTLKEAANQKSVDWHAYLEQQNMRIGEIEAAQDALASGQAWFKRFEAKSDDEF